MTAPLETFLAALRDKGCKPKKSGKGWLAHCPAHEDHTPSLDASEGSDGKVVWHCKAGCAQRAVLKALCIDYGSLVPDRSSARAVVTRPSKPKRTFDWGQQQGLYRKAIQRNQIERLAVDLGVTPESLEQIGIGWATRDQLKAVNAWGKNWDREFPDGAFAFPERDGLLRIIGIHFRTVDGRKGGPKGADRGLIVPDGLFAMEGVVHVVEGASDVAAALSVSVPAVGRPANNQGAEYVADLLRHRSMVIVGENDCKADGRWPGREGAVAVATSVSQALSVQVPWAMPPEGVKDARAYVNSQLPNISRSTRDERWDAGRRMLQGLVAGETKAPESPPPASVKFEPIDVATLVSKYGAMRVPVIEGLLRRGETMNVIGPAKKGKSWLILDLVCAVAGGTRFLDMPTTEGKVLVIDAELHRETLAQRAIAVEAAKLGAQLQFWSVRGKQADIATIAAALSGVKRGDYSVIVLDAFYRFLGDKDDENSNGAITRIYNAIDGVADRLDAAVVVVHHSSKGSQSAKAVTDVGAGAGAQSRAADTHLVLRDHEAEGVLVVAAETRSWPKISPFGIRWMNPGWQLEADVDVTQLAGRGRKPPPAVKPTPAKWTTTRFANEVVGSQSMIKAAVIRAAVESGCTKTAAEQLLTLCVEERLVTKVQSGPSEPLRYNVVKKNESGEGGSSTSPPEPCAPGGCGGDTYPSPPLGQPSPKPKKARSSKGRQA